MTEPSFSHVNAAGEANMVDISGKSVTARRAVATAVIHMQPETLRAIESDALKKGEVLAVARVAGIQGAKRCADLIPLCHPLPLTKVQIDFARLTDTQLHIEAQCTVEGKTGVEMEALTAASIAALTVYDMCKAIDKTMVISDLSVQEKQGGKSGDWHRDDVKPA
jgi:cyclic pyranopterin phosphate synthase